jgi:alcohol dehydrogenase (cytochrome c)/quinohemoprotein ethanol dehydrogenase
LDTNRGQESTPLAVDGKLFTTSAWSKVQAFDAATGKLLWQFDPKVKGEIAAKACCDVVNRGAAYWEDKVYVGTIDGRLVAINSASGKQVWSTQTTDPESNQTITGAPRIIKGLVVIGNGGAELGARGYVSAYDAETGKKVWRFYTVPGEPGKQDGEISDEPLARLAAKTWAGRWWTKEAGGGGGTVWDSMAYDPQLNLLYIGVGNASYWNRKYRSAGSGDNLFVGSILALRPETGEYVWHFQQTPGDMWDFTSTQHMILTSLKIDGRERKVILQAPKNGYFYVIDRETGKLISAMPYVPLNWADGVDPITGRPKIKPEADYGKSGKPFLAMPGSLGGHNWQPMSYSPKTGLVYIPVHEVPTLYSTDPNFKTRPVGINLGIDLSKFTLSDDPRTKAAALKSMKGYLLAWDPVTQREVWRAPHPSFSNGGVLSTAGGIVFQGDTEGFLNAYNARTGAKIWSFDGQSGIIAAPISFAVQGRQYVTVVVGYGGANGLFPGEAGWGKGGPRRNKSRVMTFALDANGPALPPLTKMVVAPLVTPAQPGTSASILAGGQMYQSSCFVCHGGAARSTGIVPDLRRSAAVGDAQTFYSVVGDGLLADRGMVSFSKMYDRSQIEAIRAYIISRSRRDAGLAEARTQQ